MNISNIIKKFPNERLISLDIETTGGKKGVNRIIQVGVVEIKNGTVIKEYSKMFGGGTSLPVCIQVHGIQDIERKDCPLIETCITNLCKYMSNSIIIGHNVISCDLRLIRETAEANKCMFENIRVIDTYKLSKKVLPIKKHNLEICCAELGLTFGKHDALGDARSSLEVLDAFIKKREHMEADYFLEEYNLEEKEDEK